MLGLRAAPGAFWEPTLSKQSRRSRLVNDFMGDGGRMTACRDGSSRELTLERRRGHAESQTAHRMTNSSRSRNWFLAVFGGMARDCRNAPTSARTSEAMFQLHAPPILLRARTGRSRPRGSEALPGSEFIERRFSSCISMSYGQIIFQPRMVCHTNLFMRIKLTKENNENLSHTQDGRDGCCRNSAALRGEQLGVPGR